MRCVSTAQLSVEEGSRLGLVARRARQGRQRSWPSGELRDSDGSELIRLCCWCYTCCIFGDGVASLALSLFALPLPQSVSLWISFILSLVISLWPSVVVVVKVCCRPERLSPQFSMAES